MDKLQLPVGDVSNIKYLHSYAVKMCGSSIEIVRNLVKISVSIEANH